MSELDHRPSTGSCACCRASLGLASLKRRGHWYCSSACAEGRGTGEERRSAVPEDRLYPRPRRFFKKRQPLELRARSRSD